MPPNPFGQGSAPLASGTPNRSATGFEGTPLEGMGFLHKSLGKMMSGMGMMPMGLHDQNVFDFTRNRQFNMMQNDLMRRMITEESETTWMRNAQGAARAVGMPFGPDQQDMFKAGAGLIKMVGPMLATQAPGVLEGLGGRTGSSAVMASRLIQASRQRMDPLTGQMGMDIGALEQMSKDLSRSFEQDPRSLGGFTKGQMGGLALSMQQRGMLGGYDQKRDFQEWLGDNMGAARAVLGEVDPQNLPADAMKQLREAPETASKLRAFDAKKVKASLGDFTGAMAAMKDVFADLGKVPQSMEELMRGLEQFTAGAVGQVSPQRLANIVRTTRELARGAGVPIETAIGMQQHAVNRAQQLGLHSLLGVQANQGALAFGGAYRGTGQGQHAAWGRLSSDQVQQMDSNLRVNAAGSEAANRAAVVMRLRDLHGGFAEGSEAATLAAQIESGTLDKTPDIGRLTEILTSSPEQKRLGITSNTVQNMLSQRFQNQESIHTYGIGGMVRKQQPKEFWSRVETRMGETIYSRLTGQGVDDRTAHRIAEQAKGKITQRVRGMSNADFTNKKARTDAIGSAIRDVVGSSKEGADALEAVGREVDPDAFDRGSANAFYGTVDQWIRDDKDLRGMGGFQGAQQVQSDEGLRQADIRAQSAEVDVILSASTAHLAKGGMLRSFFQALQESPNADIGDIAARTMGGVPKDKINQEGLKTASEAVRAQLKKIATAREALSKIKDPKKRKEALSKIEGLATALIERQDAVAKMFTDVGMDPNAMKPSVADDAVKEKKVEYDNLLERLGNKDRVDAKLETEKADIATKKPSTDAERVSTEKKPSDGDSEGDVVQVKITGGNINIDGTIDADGTMQTPGKNISKAEK